jgi:hypothetical protein
MPIFVAPNLGRVVATNYKVAYSSLSALSHFHEITRRQFVLLKMLRRTPPRGYFLVRNPYDRLVSSYADKIQNHPKRYAEEGFYWQKCQRQIASFIGVRWSASSADIAEQFLSCSFDRFVSGLHAYTRRLSVWSLDAHLQPQSCLLFWLRRGGSATRFEFVPIENEAAANAALRMAMPRENVSSHGSVAEYFNDEILGKVNQIYNRDFIELPYERRTSFA